MSLQPEALLHNVLGTFAIQMATVRGEIQDMGCDMNNVPQLGSVVGRDL